MCNFTFGSLFAGIGGFDLGFERAGLKCLWQVEKDKYCLKILEKHWPNVQRFDDILTLKNPPYVDVICGGFPCQDISNAGKRKGIKGERSGLWTEMLRIICEVRPKYIVVENVAALINRGLSTVLGELAESGYDAEWQVLSAAAFGAPHLRERVFIVAYPRNDTDRTESRQKGKEEEIQGKHRSSRCSGMSCGASSNTRNVANSNSNGTKRDKSEDRKGGRIKQNGQNVSYSDIDGLERKKPERGRSGQSRLLTKCDWWSIEPDVGRVAHGVSRRLDRLKCLGNAVVPQITEYIGRLLITHNKSLNLT